VHASAAGSIAVLVASITSVAFLSKWLSLAGLLLGIWLSFAQLKAGKAHYPLAAAVLCVLTLLFAGNWPRFRSKPQTRPELVVIPHDDSGLVPERPLQEGEWVDAAANDMRRHDVRLRIVSATVGPVELQRTTEKPLPSKTKHLVLTDSKEKSYVQDTFDPLKVAGRGDKKLTIIGSQIREVLVYPAAAAEGEYLHLELPASAYGLEGTFRFQIPNRMIQDSSKLAPSTQPRQP
jgi:hypothetical protein